MMVCIYSLCSRFSNNSTSLSTVPLSSKSAIVVGVFSMPFGLFRNKKKELSDLVNNALSDGILTGEEYSSLIAKAEELKIDKSLIDKLRISNFDLKISSIKKKIEQDCSMSPEQQRSIDKIAEDLGVSYSLEPSFQKYKAIWEYENLGKIDLTPIPTDVILQTNENAFSYIAATWQQLKKKRTNEGFIGGGFSFRVAKGVRFSVGRAFPVSREYEEMTDLSNGILMVTYKRIIFNGSRRNTSITRGRLISINVFEDGIEIGKSSGQPDFFQMDRVDAVFTSAVINEVLINPNN